MLDGPDDPPWQLGQGWEIVEDWVSAQARDDLVDVVLAALPTLTDGSWADAYRAHSDLLNPGVVCIRLPRHVRLDVLFDVDHRTFSIVRISRYFVG